MSDRNKWGELPKPITLESVMKVYEAETATLRALAPERAERGEGARCWCGLPSRYESGWCGKLHPAPPASGAQPRGES